MRKSKKQLLRALIACGLVVSVAAGGTVAYLTDAETATNTFTVGKVKIDLEEPGYPGNDSDEVKNIIPNQEIVKDPQIENTGNNDALVFIRVEIPQETFTDEDDGTGEQKKQDLFRLKGVSDQWEPLRTETVAGEDGKAKTSYVYGYKKTLGKDATTDKLFQKVQMKNAVESDLSGNVEDIVVTACAIQATDIPDVNLTPGSDGNLSKDVLDQVYTIFLNQSGNQTSRPADEGNRNQTGKLGKISYALDGGTLADGSLTEYGSADYGYTPPEPTKEGFRFAGWSPASIPADSAGNITFTAQWEENSVELLDGKSINAKMKRLAGTGSAEYETRDTAITAIQRTDEEPTEAVMTDANSLISTNASAEPVYAWFENGVIKWWSEAKDVNAGESLSYLCYNMQNLTDISGLNEWQTNKVTDMSYMFYGCSNLTGLVGLADWDTGNVTKMSGMFYNCSQLTDLTPLTNWQTGKVTDMSFMFDGCIHIVSLAPLSNWQTGKVTNMSYMFDGCWYLTDLVGLADWDTGNVTNMMDVFKSCSQLTDPTPLTNWQTGKVTDMSDMFFGCSNLTSLVGLADWDTGNVTNMSAMFYNCSQLTDPTPLTNWQTDKVTDMSDMFFGCSNLTSLVGLADWDTGNVTSMSTMFYGCSKLTDLTPLTNWQTGKVTDMDYMFFDCARLTNTVGINSWDISKVTRFTSMFGSCPSHPEFTKRSGTWDSGTFEPTT